jgi:hypothetical protein
VDEVKVALLCAILEKREDAALFWAYELYYSGYEKETMDMLWQVYHDFYYTLNPSFQRYFVKKVKEHLTDSNPRILLAIIGNLVIRPFNTDVFVLRNPTTIVDKRDDDDDNEDDFQCALMSSNLNKVARYIMEVHPARLDNTFVAVIQYFIEKGISQLDEKKNMHQWKKDAVLFSVDPAITLLAFTTQCFSQLAGLKQGNKLYVNISHHDDTKYTTVTSTQSGIRSENILSHVYKYRIDESSLFRLFHFNREENLDMPPEKAYRLHWEYYASFSPVWRKRMEAASSRVDHDLKKVIFLDEDKEDVFYEEYGYEPDEQTRETQCCSLGVITKASVSSSVQALFKGGNRLVIRTEQELMDAFNRALTI